MAGQDRTAVAGYNTAMLYASKSVVVAPVLATPPATQASPGGAPSCRQGVVSSAQGIVVEAMPPQPEENYPSHLDPNPHHNNQADHHHHQGLLVWNCQANHKDGSSDQAETDAEPAIGAGMIILQMQQQQHHHLHHHLHQQEQPLLDPINQPYGNGGGCHPGEHQQDQYFRAEWSQHEGDFQYSAPDPEGPSNAAALDQGELPSQPQYHHQHHHHHHHNQGQQPPIIMHGDQQHPHLLGIADLQQQQRPPSHLGATDSNLRDSSTNGDVVHDDDASAIRVYENLKPPQDLLQVRIPPGEESRPHQLQLHLAQLPRAAGGNVLLAAAAPPTTTAATQLSVGSSQVQADQEPSSNLMWLLDFKLDFFNDPDSERGVLALPAASLIQTTSTAGTPCPQSAEVEELTTLTPLVAPGPRGASDQTTPSSYYVGQQQVVIQSSEGGRHGHHVHQVMDGGPDLQHQLHRHHPEPAEMCHVEPIASTNVSAVATASPSVVQGLQTTPDPRTENNLEQDPSDESAKSGDASCKKPPYTYTELITQALKDQTALTVSGIYNWITHRFQYFKAEDDRWKNSVRHNLSMNPHFRKGTKAKHGSGHLWVLADYDQEDGCKPGSSDINSSATTTTAKAQPPHPAEPAKTPPPPLPPAPAASSSDPAATTGVKKDYAANPKSQKAPSANGEDDEAARAVRSILDRNEADILDRSQEEANKENSIRRPQSTRKRRSSSRVERSTAATATKQIVVSNHVNHHQLGEALPRDVSEALFVANCSSLGAPPGCEDSGHIAFTADMNKLEGPDIFVTTEVDEDCTDQQNGSVSPKKMLLQLDGVIGESGHPVVVFSPQEHIEELTSSTPGFHPCLTDHPASVSAAAAVAAVAAATAGVMDGNHHVLQQQ